MTHIALEAVYQECLLRRGTDADALHDAILTMIPRLQASQDPLRYLAKVASRKRYRYGRPAARRMPPAVSPVLDVASPLLDVLRSESIDAVRRAVAQLPRRERQVVMGRDFQGRNCKEIAARLSQTAAAIRSVLARAHRRLRRSLHPIVSD